MPENEIYRELEHDEFRKYCISLNESGTFMFRFLFAADERVVDGSFKIYAGFSERGKDIFHILFMKLKEDNPKYRSLTPDIPAAHWYERKIR